MIFAVSLVTPRSCSTPLGSSGAKPIPLDLYSTTMHWTVSKRIMTGFAIVLTLTLVVTALAIWALHRTRNVYEVALDQRREGVVPSLQAESEVRAANGAYLRYLLEGDDLAARARDSIFSIHHALLEKNRDATTGPQRELWERVIVLSTRWDSISRASMAARRSGNMPEALRIRRMESQPLRVQIDQQIRLGARAASALADSTASGGNEIANVSQTILLAGALFALMGGVLTAVTLNAAVSRPLQETSGGLASGTAEILAATTEQASGANETLAAVSETVATVDEVAQTASQAADRAQGVADSARRAAEIGVTGRQAIDESVTAMTAVREQVETIGRSILVLAEQAQAIGDITAAVSDIAEQTNLLALNAAVEAARAGEAGRGFAVVAGEIKSLAEQSKRSTVQVRQLLSEIQRATNASVMATEQGTKQVNAANKQVSDAGATIRSLVAAVSEAAQTSAQIVASAGQQALGMEQIRQAVSSIHEATQQNLTASRQSEQAAQDISRLGSQLLDLVGTRTSRS